MEPHNMDDANSSHNSFPNASPSPPTSACDTIAVVYPRKKFGQPQVRGQRVSLSKEDIEKLFHLRQVEAAELLGLSLTALKTVCRKVGILRWPYSRDRQLAAPGRVSLSGGRHQEGIDMRRGELLEEGTVASEGGHESASGRAQGLGVDEEQGAEEMEGSLDAKWIAWYMFATDESSVSMR
eukprot:752581-Hanusia_phi.AAC.2